VRAFKAVGGKPVLVARANGPILVDTEGRRFTDLIMGWGALILGHAHPRVTAAIRTQAAAGSHFGLTCPGEAALAEAIAAAVSSIEQVRFTASGTEACMTAIRLARAATGRSNVLTFEGCYHGHSDGLLVKRGSGLATLGIASSAGVPETIASQTLIAPYQDLEALERIFRDHGGELAGAIVEPVAANTGVIVPQPRFLRRLRELTSQHGALLIFDEVVTGFRLAFGGAQALFDVAPDLTVLGKIIGGGLPIGAVGGPRALMSQLAPEGRVYHAGTFAGHPLSMAAGLATLLELRRSRPYRALEKLGVRLAEGLRAAARRWEAPVQVQQIGSMLTVFFHGSPVRDFADAQQADRARFAAFANRLRHGGVLVPPSPFEAMFLSTAHTQPMIDRVVELSNAAFRAAASSGTRRTALQGRRG
jgi:glutamate-1-semialdehyde 2,1-aminomutase